LKSSSGDSPVVRELKAAMLQDLKPRYQKSYNFLLKCTFMDPRFKTLPFLNDVEKSSVQHDIIIDVCKVSEEPVKVKVEPESDDSAPKLWMTLNLKPPLSPQ
jgi:hypothetical protein